MRLPKSIKIIASIIISLALIYILLPGYLQKGLRYFTADIDDYEIFDNREVEAGAYIPWPYVDDYNSYRLSAAEMDTFRQFKTVAYLVAVDGKLAFEKYWGDYDSLSLSNSFSMAKTIVSLLTGIAIKEGKLNSLDDPVGKYLPHFAEGDNNQLTIRHLLTMSSGLNWDESYASPFSKTTIAYYGDNLEKLMMGLDVVETPGQVFKYYSANTQIMGFVLQAATGETLSQYASEKLWKPLGTSANALWSLDKEEGMEKAYCCFNSNARDFARLGQMVLDSGRFHGRQLVPGDFIEELLSPASNLVTPSGKPVDFYGLAIWMLNFNGQPIYYFRGILGQYIMILPDRGAVVVRLGEKRSKKYYRNAPSDIIFYLRTAFSILNQE